MDDCRERERGSTAYRIDTSLMVFRERIDDDEEEINIEKIVIKEYYF